MQRGEGATAPRSTRPISRHYLLLSNATRRMRRT